MRLRHNSSQSMLQPHKHGFADIQDLSKPFWHWFSGTVSQILTKLNMIILEMVEDMSGKVQLTWHSCYLRVKPCDISTKKAKSLKMKKDAHHAECSSAVSWHIFLKNDLQTQKHYLQKVHLHNPMTTSEYFTHLVSAKWIFCPIPPKWWNGTKDQWRQNHWTDLQKIIEFI